MAYINPAMATSPKAAIKNLKVIYDGGEQGSAEGEWIGWSIATFDWHGEPSVGARWNGTDGNVGNPQSRGVPTWFVLPGPLAEAAINAARAKRR